jgi:predicted kinase
MAKIFFICGFIGSGKTTYAKQLAESASAFRFSVDEWMIPLYGEHMPRDVFDARIATLTSLFQDAAAQLIPLGTSVIFDFGFWTKQDRQKMMAWADAAGYEYDMHYLAASFELCCQRATRRNESRGDHAYEMTAEMLDLFWSWFEVPTRDENLTIIPCH